MTLTNSTATQGGPSGSEVLSSLGRDCELQHRLEAVGAIRLHWVEAGRGPLIVLLHGFPEFWYSWRHQIVALAQNGFRIVAPDMRGYGLSDKPVRVSDYRIEELTADVAGLITACGEESAIVVGHDWGGAAAWMFAMRYPQLLRRLAILNVPHPQRMLAGLKTPRQLLRSSYMFWFQIPHLPESMIRARDFRLLRHTLKYDPLRADAFTDDDVDRYVTAFSHPGALTAAINYYRAALRRGPGHIGKRLRMIPHDTLVIWGQQDRFLGSELAAPDPYWVPNCRLHRLQHASHWVQNDAPSDVNRLLIEFCGR